MLRSSINIQLQCIERSVAQRRGQILSNKRGWQQNFSWLRTHLNNRSNPQPTVKTLLSLFETKTLTLIHRSPPSSPRKALLQILLLKFTKCTLQPLSTIQFILFFLLFLRYLLLGVFDYQEKSLLLLRFLPHLRTFRGPSQLLLFLSLDTSQICYFCDICHGCFYLARKIPVTFAIFAIFLMGVSATARKPLLLLRFQRYLRTFRGPSWLLLFLSLEFC